MSQELGPYLNYDFLRRSGDLHWTGRTWLAVSYDSVAEGWVSENLSARRVDQLFQTESEIEAHRDLYETLKSWTFFSDVSDVKAERKFIWDQLGPKTLSDLPELVSRVTTSLASGCQVGRNLDVLRNLTRPLRASVVRRFLELGSGPELDLERALVDADQVFEFITSAQLSASQIHNAAKAMERLKKFLSQSALLRSPEISSDRILNQLTLLAVVSVFIEKAVANVFAEFATKPGVWDSVRAGKIDLSAAVKEALRLESPTQITSRVARVDFSWRGQKILAGQAVALVIGSANRDERAESRPLTFGAGGKRCPGEWLTNSIVEKVFAVFAERNLPMKIEPGGLVWLVNPESRRPTKLLVEF